MVYIIGNIDEVTAAAQHEDGEYMLCFIHCILLRQIL